MVSPHNSPKPERWLWLGILLASVGALRDLGESIFTDWKAILAGLALGVISAMRFLPKVGSYFRVVSALMVLGVLFFVVLGRKELAERALVVFFTFLFVSIVTQVAVYLANARSNKLFDGENEKQTSTK